MHAEDKRLLRIIDANINRCREGLRVIEDAFRFTVEYEPLRKYTRGIRHALEQIVANREFAKMLLQARDAKNDPGREFDVLEANRRDIFDIVYANFQRAKEAARVLEELFKIIDKHKVKSLKKIRYDIYAAEKKTFARWSSLYHS